MAGYSELAKKETAIKTDFTDYTTQIAALDKLISDKLHVIDGMITARRAARQKRHGGQEVGDDFTVGIFIDTQKNLARLKAGLEKLQKQITITLEANGVATKKAEEEYTKQSTLAFATYHQTFTDTKKIEDTIKDEFKIAESRTLETSRALEAAKAREAAAAAAVTPAAPTAAVPPPAVAPTPAVPPPAVAPTPAASDAGAANTYGAPAAAAKATASAIASTTNLNDLDFAEYEKTERAIIFNLQAQKDDLKTAAGARTTLGRQIATRTKSLDERIAARARRATAKRARAAAREQAAAARAAAAQGAAGSGYGTPAGAPTPSATGTPAAGGGPAGSPNTDKGY